MIGWKRNPKQQFQRNDLCIHTYHKDMWDPTSELLEERVVILHSDRDSVGSGRYTRQRGQPEYAVFREERGFIAWICEKDLKFVSADRGELLEQFEDEYYERHARRMQEIANDAGDQRRFEYAILGDPIKKVILG